MFNPIILLVLVVVFIMAWFLKLSTKEKFINCKANCPCCQYGKGWGGMGLGLGRLFGGRNKCICSEKCPLMGK